MIRSMVNSLRTNVARPSEESSAYFLHHESLNNLHTAATTDLLRTNMEWNESLADIAKSLIFGERKYTEFTSEEQRIVDIYQGKKLEEDAVILPNTRAALEEAEIQQILVERDKKKY